MGCGSSSTVTIITEEPGPENDVDMRSVKSFEKEQQAHNALLSRDPSALSRDASAVTRSSYRSEYGDTLPVGSKQTDQISLQSVKGQGEIPPLAPPRRKKKDLIPDPSIFDSVDQLVRNIPNSATTSVYTLATYLSSQCTSDLHLVRAVFSWITFNIDYDAESYVRKTTRPQDPSTVLKSRTAVCEGFSSLCEALCNAAGVPCLSVRGIVKGYSHVPETEYAEAEKNVNHAWNLALVQGEWWPLDPAWGAGFLREDGTFCREFNDHWFLTDPEYFITSHFPVMGSDPAHSMKFQLVVPPCSSGTFSKMVRMLNIGPRMGLKLLTHRESTIDVWDDVTIKMEATEKNLLFVTAYLTIRSPKAEHRDGTACITSVDNHVITVYVRPPKPREYWLTVRGKAVGQPIHCPGQEQVELQQMVVYLIRCRRSVPNAHPFPCNQGYWGLQEPVATRCGLKNVKNAPFGFSAKDGELTVPVPLTRYVEMATQMRHALAMHEEMSQYTILEYKEGGAIIKVRLPKAGHYLLRLFAKFPKLKGMQHVADYLLLSETSHPDLQPFPRAYSYAYEQRTSALEPTQREVHRDESLMYRIRAPNLLRVKVNETGLDRKKTGVFEGIVTPPTDLTRKQMLVSGSDERDIRKLTGMYAYDIPDRVPCRLFPPPPTMPDKLTVGGPKTELAFYPPTHPEPRLSERKKKYEPFKGCLYLH